MEILLNDLSINGQFTYDTFSCYMMDEVLPIMKILQEHNILLLKSYDIYSKKITRDMSVEKYIHIQGDPIVDRFKEYLVSLAYEEPYWEDDMKSSMIKDYGSKADKNPNCITEAYERQGIIFSFFNGGYDEDAIEIVVDGNETEIPNFTLYKFLKPLLARYGVIESWNSNSFVIHELGYKFEVRFNEGHHNIAHFHLSNANVSASISIPDADIIEGKLENKNKTIAWCMRNMHHIVQLWNKYHPDRNVEM